MLETLDLSRKLRKALYKERLPVLQSRLHQLQQTCWEHGLASILLFEGWSASGKGNIIRKLTQKLEPRGFSLHLTREPRTSETHMPWLWRFWVRLPNWGEMAIFDHCWYRRVLDERVFGRIGEQQCQQAFGDSVSLERTLADDRYVLVKFFLHIDLEEQRDRFERLLADPLTAWHVDDEDWEQNRRYKEFLAAVEEMLERTESEWGPWTLVEGTDQRWARVKVFETTIAALEEGLVRHGIEVPKPAAGGADEDDDD
jgi:polyphosphate kinase 2 (PPK2 family)